jgi:hypothetical protein
VKGSGCTSLAGGEHGGGQEKHGASGPIEEPGWTRLLQPPLGLLITQIVATGYANHLDILAAEHAAKPYDLSSDGKTLRP